MLIFKQSSAYPLFVVFSHIIQLSVSQLHNASRFAFTSFSLTNYFKKNIKKKAPENRTLVYLFIKILILLPIKIAQKVPFS